jgi:hypothetical protein
VVCDSPRNLLASIGAEVLDLRVADPAMAVAVLRGRGIAEHDIAVTGSTVTASLRDVSAQHVTEHLARVSVTVHSATTRRPSLDDVYLRLTGAHIAAGTDN